MQKMVIVIESPNKIEKFRKLLPRAAVFATAGHFKDLPEKEMGVDLETFEPRFVKNRNKAAAIRQIVEAAKDSIVYVATDADREGYAIGKFVFDEVRYAAAQVMRAEIREITKKGIEEGLAAAIPFEETNLSLFESWKGRRVGDRIVGYILSPEATKTLGGKGDVYSVGRVQSSAVRLLVEREREIRTFVSRPFWKLRLYGVVGEDEVIADMDREEARFFDLDEAERTLREVRGWLQHTPAIVESVEQDEAKRNPPAPFTTSTLQQAASSQLGFDSEKTMNMAQKLFEGGWITYHRVDSTELSTEFQEMVKTFVSQSRYAEYYDRPKSYKPKGKKATEVQAAHEAIRPTAVGGQKSIAKEVAEKFGEEGLKLYELIYRRAVASQMKPALYDTLEATIGIGRCPTKFVLKGRVLRFPGFLAFYDQDRDEGEKIETATLPSLKQGDVISEARVALQKGKTQPPLRYTEAALVKRLEKEGIGRPSTYASIIAVIKRRGYVVVEKKKLAATKKAERLIDWLAGEYSWLIEYEMTRKMEEYLDLIAGGEGKYLLFCQALHKRMGEIRPIEFSQDPPSKKQLELARSLAEEAGILLPDKVVRTKGEITEFIDRMMRKRPVRISDAQARIIRNYAPKEVTAALEEGTPERLAVCRKWLDDYFRSLGRRQKKRRPA